MALEDYFQGGCAPVLIVDDEEGDVADLIRVFQNHYAKLRSRMEIPHLFFGGFYDYVSCSEEALLLMKQEQEKGCKYKAIITDFHMAPIDGKDFLRVVFDRFGYALTRDSSFRDKGLEELNIKSFEDLEREFHIANKDVLDFVTGNFKDLNDYKRFLKYWNNPDFEIVKVIFAGAERGDYTDDRELEMTYFKKLDNSEEAILDFLCISGVLPPDVYESFYDYSRFDPNLDKKEKKFIPGKTFKKWRTTQL